VITCLNWNYFFVCVNYWIFCNLLLDAHKIIFKNQIGSSKNYLSKEEISRWDFGASTVMKLIEAFFTQNRCRFPMMMMVRRKRRWRKVIARVRSIFIICVANHSSSVHNNQPVPVNKMKLMDICAVNRVWKMLWMINWWGLISRWKFLNYHKLQFLE